MTATAAGKGLQRPDPKKDARFCPRPPQYGTFPSSSSAPSAPPLAVYPGEPKPQTSVPPRQKHDLGFHAVPVGRESGPYPGVVDGIPVLMKQRPLPLCGMGIGWALFVSGFFLAAVPWYVGALILIFVAVDPREKAGLIASTVAAVLVTVPVVLNAFRLYPA